MAKAVKRATPAEVELRRWCIEQAIRWPVVMGGGYNQAISGVVAYPAQHDADVLGRAERLIKWVKSSA